MTELRQRMIEAMVVRGFAQRTQEAYVDAIRRMAQHYRRDPASYTAQEVQDYLLHMVRQRSLSYSTMNQTACAARFLYETVLGRARQEFLVPMAKVPQRQPELLGRAEISQLLLACGQPRQRMLLQTVYAAGLRVSEACALEVRDIDSAPDRMCIRVRSGKVTGYPNATLGNEIQSMSSAQGGILEMAITSTAGAAGNVKELAIFDLPFLFRSVKEADAVVDGEVGQSLLKKFPEKNLIGLCYMDWGFRQVTNNKHPIKRLEDFRDLKLRTLQNRVYIDTFKALGATPLPLPYPETYTALETKAIDGQESSYLVTKSSSYQDIQTYLTETRHFYLPAVVLVSKKFWDRLSTAERDVLESSCKEAQAYHREVSRKMEADVVKDLVKAGMKFNTIEPAEQARMVQATASVIEKYKPELGADLVNATLATIDKARKAP